MTDITKKVDRIIPGVERAVTFTEADGGEGDVFLVRDSLGRVAAAMDVETSANLVFRLNVYRNIYHLRAGNDLLATNHLANLTSGEQTLTSGIIEISLAGGETFSSDGDFPVRDVQIKTADGTFLLTLS